MSEVNKFHHERGCESWSALQELPAVVVGTDLIGTLEKLREQMSTSMYKLPFAQPGMTCICLS